MNASGGSFVAYQIPYEPEKIAPGIHKNLLAPQRNRLFYVSCGEEDPLWFSHHSPAGTNLNSSAVPWPTS